MARASIVADHRCAADADVQRRLRELGIVGPAAILFIASSEAGLRSVAAEIIGDGFGNDAWFALLRAWQSSTYQGRQWLLQRGRELAAVPARFIIPPHLVVDVDSDDEYAAAEHAANVACGFAAAAPPRPRASSTPPPLRSSSTPPVPLNRSNLGPPSSSAAATAARTAAT